MSEGASLVDRLCRLWRTSVPSVALARALDEAFPDLQRLQVPVALEPLAARRGITRIEVVDLEGDGQILETAPGAFTVRLNSHHSEERRRFTLAHEIGHTLFFALEHDRRSSGGSDSVEPDRGVEALCNEAAAEILMPYVKARDMVQRLGAGISTIMRLKHDFQVSLEAAARRVIGVCSVKLTVVMWRAVGRQLAEEWCYSTTVRTRGGQPLVVGHDDPAQKVLASREPYSGWVWISLGGPLQRYYVDALPLKSRNGVRVLTLFLHDRRAQALVARRAEGQVPRVQLPLLSYSPGEQEEL